MISVVIPTLNAEAGLAATLASLVPAVVDGIVREVVVVDGGSTDRTLAVVDQAGAELVAANVPGRGRQMIDGAERARHPWLLFLHADTVLEDGWQREVETFMTRIESGARPDQAAVFSFALEDNGTRPRLLEKGVAARNVIFGLPYGDQGLLISRRLYREIGGYRPIEIMEDVDIVRRLGRRRIHRLRARAVTSAVRYTTEGYARRSLLNLTCLGCYLVGVQPTRIRRLYDRKGGQSL